MVPGCLKDMKALAFPWQLKDLAASALAAKVRVVMFEAGGALDVHRRAARLQSMLSAGDDHTLMREGWLQRWRPKCFLIQLAEADEEVAAQLRQVPADSAWLTEQTGWQRRVADLGRAAPGVLAHRHLRRRLDRWQAATLPGHRLPRVLHRLHRLAACCTPRVQAAYLRLVCNGLCTHRRFQGKGRCLFGCGDHPDSIEHFAFCSVPR